MPSLIATHELTTSPIGFPRLSAWKSSDRGINDCGMLLATGRGRHGAFQAVMESEVGVPLPETATKGAGASRPLGALAADVTWSTQPA